MQSATATAYGSMNTPTLLSDAWDKTTDIQLRNQILTTILQRERAEDTTIWPSAQMAERDEMAGLYPNASDPQFAARLFGKQEFYESRAVAAGVADGGLDPCSSAAADAVFELTPIQRIVSRFLHPLTPYMGVLIDHGVGVGKTCTAVSIAEQFLAVAPTRKVIVLVPQALKDNFKRTVFDPTKMVWDDVAKEWTARQCTGVSYLQRLGLLNNPNRDTVIYKVEEDKRARYTVTGYQAFANWIKKTLAQSLPASMTDLEARRIAENEILRRLFSEHLIIIDEAHNLRDTATDGPPAAADAEDTGTDDAVENAGGKALNPYLKRIVLNAEGLRLVLMTATPMYNAAPEICLLLSYLLMNDTKKESHALRTSEFFSKDGSLLPGRPQVILERIARRYVTYMRGENPYTFPIRMRPLIASEASRMWPTISATKRPVDLSEQDRAILDALPIVFTTPEPGSPPEQLLRAGTSRADQRADQVADETGEPAAGEPPAADAMLIARVQMGNISYPGMLYGTAGWDAFFMKHTAMGSGHKIRQFSPKEDVDSVFAGGGLRKCAPKIHRIVASVKAAKGICFAYSQYIKAGALPLAVALERAGFQRRLANGSLVPLLTDVPAVKPLCAICGKQGMHPEEDHPFRPACYILLTSDEEISPQFAGLIAQATNWPNDPEWGPLGSNVKVIIGSRVASEGLDLKCVREMHLLDAWYHLNRTEQIIGRAIRYCSHTALRPIEVRQGLPPMSLNNCLIYLHTLRIADSPDPAGPRGFETADMYAYRISIGKAQAIGRVQRLLKRHAWDCNLELEAIIFAGLPPRPQIDAQGNRRRTVIADGEEMDGYPINDQDFTTYCDYQVCRHECAMTVARSVEEGLHLDSSTFTVTDARRIVLAKQQIIRRLFKDQVMLPTSVIQDVFADLPWEIASEALMELLDGTRFRLTRPDGIEGFLVAKAGYIVFQPAKVTDSNIPMTLRYARAFQLRRHFMQPQLPVLARAEERPAPRTTAPRAITAATAAASSEPREDEAPALVISSNELISKWHEWLEYVNSYGLGTVPDTLKEIYHLWRFLLQQYRDIPETRYIALRWWFDKMLSYAEQNTLLEIATRYTPSSIATNPVVTSAAAGGAGDDSEEETIRTLSKVLESDIVRATVLRGYRIYNPTERRTEYVCLPATATEFQKCNPQIVVSMNKVFNKTPIAVPADTGALIGFMAPKRSGTLVVFKSLDLTKPQKRATHGAECANTSNKAEHYERVRILQAAGREDPTLAPYMLPDITDEWTPAKARERRDAPIHMLDLQHQPVCLYMEWLTRLFDARRVQGKRWFMDVNTAVLTGIAK